MLPHSECQTRKGESTRGVWGQTAGPATGRSESLALASKTKPMLVKDPFRRIKLSAQRPPDLRNVVSSLWQPIGLTGYTMPTPRFSGAGRTQPLRSQHKTHSPGRPHPKRPDWHRLQAEPVGTIRFRASSDQRRSGLQRVHMVLSTVSEYWEHFWRRPLTQLGGACWWSPLRPKHRNSLFLGGRGVMRLGFELLGMEASRFGGGRSYFTSCPGYSR